MTVTPSRDNSATAVLHVRRVATVDHDIHARCDQLLGCHAPNATRAPGYQRRFPSNPCHLLLHFPTDPYW